THEEGRLNAVKKNVAKYKLPMIYCNTIGSQTEIVFDGGSLVMNAQEEVVAVLPHFQESLQSVVWREDGSFAEPPMDASEELDKDKKSFAGYDATEGIEEIHAALLLGIRDYFGKMGFSKAIVASSGGIDSALVLALACEALGAENVHALLMPSQFSTTHSVADAVQLSENLGNPYDILAIKDIFEQYLHSLKPVFKELPFSVAEENLQSRIRGALVMALSNKFEIGRAHV